MTTLHHPKHADVTVDVKDADVASWTAAGWLKNEPRSKAVQSEKD